MNLGSVQKILVIKLRHLGDVLLASPVFANLKKAFPDSEIDAYVWKEAKPILEGHPAIHSFHLHDRTWKTMPFQQRILKELKLLREIRAQKYDLVISLTEGDRGAIAARVSGARTRVGVDSGKKSRKSFTHLVKPCPNPRHTVERDLDALRKLGIFPNPNERDLFFHVPEYAKLSVRALIADEPFVLMHAMSRWRFKCPPASVMARVIDMLGARVILTGAPSEREFVEEIILQTKADTLNLAGKTSLKEMGALMQKAKAVITVDSVSLHMASALKVPLVALFGPTSEQNWGPWQHPRSQVVAQNFPCRPCRLDGCGGSKVSDCLVTLSPEEIVEAYKRVVYPSTALTDSASASSLFVLNSLDT